MNTWLLRGINDKQGGYEKQHELMDWIYSCCNDVPLSRPAAA